MNFRPGINTRIVTEVDLAREVIHVRNSIVYDVQGSSAILAQTDPPVLKSMKGKPVVITYLTVQDKAPVRYGFPAEVVRFIDDYRLSSYQTVKAIEILLKAEPAPYSIRMFYRVEPTTKSRLAMAVFHKDVNLLDISLGGARFSHDKQSSFEEGRVVELYITMDGQEFVVDGRIQRTWDGDVERFKNALGFVSVEFLNMDRNVEHALSRKIREIERAARFNEVFP